MEARSRTRTARSRSRSRSRSRTTTPTDQTGEQTLTFREAFENLREFKQRIQNAQNIHVIVPEGTPTYYYRNGTTQTSQERVIYIINRENNRQPIIDRIKAENVSYHMAFNHRGQYVETGRLEYGPVILKLVSLNNKVHMEVSDRYAYDSENIIIKINDINNVTHYFPNLDNMARQNQRNTEIIAQNQGVAFEVHNEFDKINIEGLEKFLNEKVNYENSIPINEIKRKFEKIINDSDSDSNEKATKIRRLNTVLNKLGTGTSTHLISKCVLYVEKQDKKFKEAYISTFIEDCFNAYNAPEGQGVSCVKGIKERFIMCLSKASEILCLEEGGCKPDYKRLQNILKEFNKNEATQEWMEILRSNTDEGKRLKKIENPDNFKRAYKAFMLQRCLESGLKKEKCKEIINKEVEMLGSIDFFNTRTLGGTRKRKYRIAKKTYRKKKN